MNRLALLACLLVAASCGGANNGLMGDAGPTTDLAEAPPPVPMSCTLATQDPCGAAEQCSPFCDGDHLVVACRAEPAAPAAVGETCGATVVCGRGSTCISAPNIAMQCVKFCATVADCPAAKACRLVHVTYPCAPGAGEMVTIRACL